MFRINTNVQMYTYIYPVLNVEWVSRGVIMGAWVHITFTLHVRQMFWMYAYVSNAANIHKSAG